jgi:hypothetical protein
MRIGKVQNRSQNINGLNSETITNLMHKYLYSYNLTILYMFRALLLWSSGGKIWPPEDEHNNARNM